MLTVVFDLTVAVEVGLVLACLFFIYRMSTLFRAEPLDDATGLPPGARVLKLYGSLFFGAVGKVEGLAEQLPADCRELLLDMQLLVSMDSSGLDALAQLQRALARQGRRLTLCGLNPQPASLIERGGLALALGEDGIHADLAAWRQARAGAAL